MITQELHRSEKQGIYKMLETVGNIGGPCWDRTNDLLIKSQLLYQLS